MLPSSGVGNLVYKLSNILLREYRRAKHRTILLLLLILTVFETLISTINNVQLIVN